MGLNTAVEVSPDQQIVNKPMEKNEKLSFDTLEEVCDLVDEFLCYENDKSEIFWNSLYNEPTLQQIGKTQGALKHRLPSEYHVTACLSEQLVRRTFMCYYCKWKNEMYVQCLIYKYISITYGLGQKPLRQALRIIKNLTTNPAPIKSHSLDGPDALRSATSAPTSPAASITAQKRVRSTTGPSRRISMDLKAQPPRQSLGPDVLGNKLKRKVSGGYNLEIQKQAMQDEETRLNAGKLRCLLYTLFYVVNTCDARHWDFTSLRDAFLLWNKARSWGKDSSEFETTVMKMFSRPPDEEKDKSPWQRLSLNMVRNSWTSNQQTHLDDTEVGESTKYWVFKHRAKQTSTAVVITGLIDTMEKVYEENEGSKVIPLLHIFCETVIMARHVPLEILQRAYASLQMFYLWANPVTAAVKEVLDLIQIEMKAPGYFWRLIFIQEQEMQNSASIYDISSTCSSTNIFVDTSTQHGKQLQTLLQKYSAATKNFHRKSIQDTANNNRIIMRQIFNSVFGCESLDLCGLEKMLETCPPLLLSTLTLEALQAMEISVGMSNHSEAQSYIRMQLEAISNKFTEDTDDTNAAENLQQDTRGSVIFSATKPSTSSGLPQLRRNDSYLNRIAAANLEKFGLEQQGSDANDVMNHAPVTISTFNKCEISENMFQIVRTIAKEFVQEKRKSTSTSSIRSRYRSGGRTLTEDDARDSGLIEDAADIPEHPNEKLEEKVSSPIKFDYQSCGKFWEEFSERGFKEPKIEESLEDLLNTMTLDTDTELRKLENLNKLSTDDCSQKPSEKSPEIQESNYLDPEESLTLDFENITFEVGRSKPNRTKIYKNRFKTFGRKGMKVVRAVKRTASSRVANYESEYKKKTEESSQEIKLIDKNLERKSSSGESITTPPVSNSHRWRTYSDPFKKSGKRNKSGKYTHLSQIFSNQNDGSGAIDAAHRSHSSGSIRSKYEGDSDGGNQTRFYSLQKRKHSAGAESLKVEDEDSRIRIDSGIVLDKDSDRVFQRFNQSLPDWEETGVVGVKVLRKQAVRTPQPTCLNQPTTARRTRKSRASMSHMSPRPLRKKVVKLVFAGNDETLGHLARSYYQLRTKQATRAPLLQHVDLRIFYIPVGENSFADESASTPDGEPMFDLKIARMLAAYDPWYRSTVLQTTSNLLRVCPAVQENTADIDEQNGKFITPNKLVENSLLSYCRYALKTSNLPLYKATMRTSTDDLVSEVFCSSVEIGHNAYKRAVKAGRFGKLVKLSDFSNDGPPPTYSVIDYAKIGLNGSYLGLKTLNEAFYYSVQITPEELVHNNTKGSGTLLLKLIDNGKRLKAAKSAKTPSEEEQPELPMSTIRVCELNMEVTQPPQGTITICLDNSLIFTNIKSIEIQRCIAPEYEKPNVRKRRHTQNVCRAMSLPIKTFWPSS